MEQSKNRKERTNPCETDEFRTRGLRRYMCLYVCVCKCGRERLVFGSLSMELRLFSIFNRKKFAVLRICKSRNVEKVMGNYLSWNAKICRFKNAIPQISPSQTYQDFCNLLNYHFLSLNTPKQTSSISYSLFVLFSSLFNECNKT